MLHVKLPTFLFTSVQHLKTFFKMLKIIASFYSDMRKSIITPKYFSSLNISAWVQDRSPSVAIVFQWGQLISHFPFSSFNWENLSTGFSFGWERMCKSGAGLSAHSDSDRSIRFWQNILCRPLWKLRESERTKGLLLRPQRGVSWGFLNLKDHKGGNPMSWVSLVNPFSIQI